MTGTDGSPEAKYCNNFRDGRKVAEILEKFFGSFRGALRSALEEVSVNVDRRSIGCA